jgi:hypothetical protein
LPIAAIYRDTPNEPRGPWVLAGQYRVRLTVGGKTLEQPLTVKMDPRVQTPMEGLVQQFELSQQCCEGMHQSHTALGQMRTLRSQLKELRAKVNAGELADALTELDKKAASLEGAERRRRERPSGGPRQPSMASVAENLEQLLRVLQEADAVPTAQAVTACEETQRSLRALLAKWEALTSQDLKALNERLRKAELPPLTLTAEKLPSKSPQK